MESDYDPVVRIAGSITAMSTKASWKRVDAERNIGVLLDAARAGEPQTILEQDGEFLVQFSKKTANKGSAADYLARGGPMHE